MTSEEFRTLNVKGRKEIIEIFKHGKVYSLGSEVDFFEFNTKGYLLLLKVEMTLYSK